jgi:CheY-like chemotaxis protein
MSSVALASRLHSAQTEDGCSDLNQVVARVEQSIARVAGHYVGVQFSLSPNVALVAVGTAELERVVLGLCAGACSMLSPGGRLVVETRGMSDAPVGIASAPNAATEARARVVVRTERLGHPAQPELTHAYSEVAIADLEDLLRRVGGRLELVQLADSDLAFVAHLPYALASNSSGRMAIAVAHGTGAILLIEDEPQVQAVTARILRAFGYSVITAHNERTALAQAEQHGSAIGLVVSDLVLPGVSGKDLVRRLRKPCEHAQILYISGYSPDHVGALADGARFLRKPFTAQELLAIVRDLMPAVAG